MPFFVILLCSSSYFFMLFVFLLFIVLFDGLHRNSMPFFILNILFLNCTSFLHFFPALLCCTSLLPSWLHFFAAHHPQQIFPEVTESSRFLPKKADTHRQRERERERATRIYKYRFCLTWGGLFPSIVDIGI